jgi:hypothetical protein
MGVRCYWALVTPRYPRPEVPGSKLELVFIHLDPVLSVHLARQKMTFIGRGVIEFIHPAERERECRLTLAIDIAHMPMAVVAVVILAPCAALTLSRGEDGFGQRNSFG